MDKEVEDLLESLTEGVKSVFSDTLVGLYLTGSLSYGDFDPGSSDIDFMAIVKSKVTDEQRRMLVSLHEHIGALYPKWASRVDGSYLTQDILTSIQPPIAPRPFVNGGKMWQPDPPFRDDWLITIHNLRTSSKVLYGSPPVEVFPAVSIEKVKEAVRNDLNNRWAETASKLKPFEREGYDSNHLQAYAVLTMCRILHFDETLQPVSKKVAARWAKQQYPEWTDTIEIAENWKHGDVLHIEDEAKQLINFTLAEVGGVNHNSKSF